MPRIYLSRGRFWAGSISGEGGNARGGAARREQKAARAQDGGQRVAQGVLSGLSPREGWLPIEKEQCWYCRYANFHLTAPVALDVGICCYPQIQME